MRRYAPALLLAISVAACSGEAAKAPPAPSASQERAAAATSSHATAATTSGAIATATSGPRPSGPVPAPWGPAANGRILYGTTAGDIVAMDPAGGATTTILNDTERVPVLSPDGTRLVFERTSAGTTEEWLADIDGTGARVLPVRTADIGWLEWAPDSRRIVTVPQASGDATILDVDTGATSTIHAPTPIRMASWLADGRMLIASAAGPDVPVLFKTIAEDGTGYGLVPTRDAAEDYSISGDGRRFAYTSWGAEPATQGIIHVVDLSSGHDIALTKPDSDTDIVAPVFSPDSRWLMANRFDGAGSKIVLLPADRTGTPIELGREQPNDAGEAVTTWAPDASALIVRFAGSGETWRFEVASRSGGKLTWPGLGGGIGWQRAAPGS